MPFFLQVNASLHLGQGSISPTFYEQVVEVECNFCLRVLVKLAVILLLKLNGAKNDSWQKA